MRITYRGDYALKTILDLALHYGNSPVTIHELAKRADIPIKFLEQILLDLKRGGFVESRRGKIGGYLLAKAPSEIKLGEVIRFVDGPIEPIACTEKKYSGCNDLYKCVFRKIWQEVANATSKIIDNITFEYLIKKIKVSEGRFIYQI
jgi:Rrf2 family protein